MAKLLLHELAAQLADKQGLSVSEARNFLSAIFEVIRQGIANDKMVKIKGLGTFKVIEVDARESVNVNTGERVVIDSHEKVTFTPDNIMKELVNKPFSQFETVTLSDDIDLNELEAGIDEPQESLEPVIIEDEPAVEEEAPIVEDDTPVIEEETPVIEEKAPIIEEEVPEVEEAPIIEEVEPVLVEEEPIVEEEEPIVEEQEPVLVEEEPAIEEVAPDIEEEVAPVVEEEVAPIVEEETPTVEEEASVVEEETPVVEELEQPVEETQEETVNPLLEVEFLDKADETINEEEPLEEETEETEEEPIEEEDEEPLIEEERSSHAWIYWFLGMLVVGALAFAGGYYWGKKTAQPAPVVPKQEKPKVVPAAKKEVPKDTIALKDTATTVKASMIVPASSVAEKTEHAPVEEKKEVKPAPKAEEDYMKYNNMDVRLRTGAYYIMGLDRVVKAHEGDRPSTIARKTLGEDMGCYIEAYNNLLGNPVLKEGQEVKIPKIKLKKIVNKQKKTTN